LLSAIDGRDAAIITDDEVRHLHAEPLAARLSQHGVNTTLTSFPPGEANKSWRTAAALLDWLASSRFRRRDVVIAVGGGVVTDTAGWIAASYMRGVPYVNVPTTLLAQVDAALGGKVAIDHPSAKNLIGAFYQPKAVISNVAYLRTLGLRQIRSGLAEAVKKGVIASPELFTLIEEGHADILDGSPRILEELVWTASVVKCELVGRDPYEEDLHRHLNFGHTVGHALETATGYGELLHGEAVALGMAVASLIAETRGLLAAHARERIVGLLRRVGLPTCLDELAVQTWPADVLAALGQIRKIRDGNLRFVLPLKIGKAVVVDDVTDAEIRSALLATAPTSSNRWR
jgi:3-dehydroquinate synthase